MRSVEKFHTDWSECLNSGLRCVGVTLSAQKSERLLRFLALILKWNKTFNLTAVREPLEMIERHLIDSLSVLKQVHGQRILDIGTGPGLPGIPLAICMPERDFVLLDANGKKIRFVRQALMELDLENVQVLQTRVEDFLPEKPIDCLICRAFGAIPRMLELTDHLMGQKTQLLAMKGQLPREEISALPAGYRLEMLRLHVPTSLGERHLIIISRDLENR